MGSKKKKKKNLIVGANTFDVFLTLTQIQQRKFYFADASSLFYFFSTPSRPLHGLNIVSTCSLRDTKTTEAELGDRVIS
jgi:hypothetical protein